MEQTHCHHCVKMQGVCAKQIEFELYGDIVLNVRFNGGCSGQGRAVARLVDGMTVNEVYTILKDVTCGNRGTSCASELAKAVYDAYKMKEG